MARRRRTPRKPEWENLPDEALLDLRFADLGLELRGSPIEPLIDRLYRELAARDLKLRPHFWISTEWFTPDGIPGIAVPFYLTHPRLAALDKRMMRGTLAETPAFSLRVLRHEAGHALENAYRLRQFPPVEEIFGPSSRRYPRYYSPRPYSRSFVRNLGQGYAQSHPDEDFAETFAVWLTPKRAWKTAYAGWAALEKLRFMDRLMEDLAGVIPPVENRRVIEPTSALNQTLRTHYRRQRKHFRLDVPEVDRGLRSVFRESAAPRATMTADVFLRKIRSKLSRRVSELSGEPKHRVDRVVDEMIFRSRHLKLKVSPSRLPVKDGVPFALTRHAMRFLRAGLYRIAV